MDARTALTLAALDETAAAVLLTLLEGPATEAELLATVAPSQPTLNRHLEKLRRSGLIVREPGRLKAPGRAWSLAHPEETDALLTAGFALSDAIAAREATAREAAKRRVLLARAKRRGLRVVGRRESDSD